MHSNACPSDDALLALLVGGLSEQENALIAAHVDHCASCESRLVAFRQDATNLVEPAPTLDEAPSGSESEAGTPSDVAETYEFQPTLDMKPDGSQPARIDETIDSRSIRVAISGDTTNFVDLNELLEAKRGQTPPFKAERTLAQGGMGALLVGQDKALQRQIAIKVMKPKIAESDDHRARFLEEAQITGQLEHPNIVPIHDLGKDAEGNLYFTMKLVKGHSLGQILTAMKEGEARRSLAELLNIVLKIADGLAFAHSKGVVHRDLKPDNIMVGDYGEVLVMDWGLAKLLGSEREAVVSSPVPGVDIESDASDDAVVQTIKSVRATDFNSRTLDGTIQGTPAYMPPEQARGKIDEIDQRSDVYSLGAILYEILTLDRPIEGETMSQLVKNAATGNVIPPEERTPDRFIPAELSAVVMKAMRFARDERYQTVKEFEQDINLFLGGRAVSAKEDSFRESVVKLIRRNKAVSGAMAVAATIILVLASFSYVRITDERDRAIENEQAASDNAVRATRNEQRALTSEAEAVEAQQAQWETAMAASKQFALQTVELANLNQLDPAQRRAKDAAIVAPDGPWQFFASGAIAMARVDFDSAIALYQTALSKPDGQQPEIQAALSDALARHGRLGEAESLLAEIEKIEDWRILLGAGRVLYKAEKWEACQRPLSRAIELMEQEKDRPNENLAEAQRLLDAAPAQLACVGFYDEIRNLPLTRLQQRVAEKITEIHGFPFRPERLSADAKGNLRFNGQNGFGLQGPKHLYPLKGIPITSMNLVGSRAWDLSSLIGMPLETLNLGRCDRLVDLQPLATCSTLRELRCGGTGVTDLTPLQELSLTHLTCFPKNYASLDITPLGGLPLEELKVTTSDISPLKGAPLRSLNISLSRIANLEPLRGMALESLDCSTTQVRDLSPLAGMPIKELHIGMTPVSDLSSVKECPIETITIGRTSVADLSPFAAMPLKELDLTRTLVTDLNGLKGAKLESLDLTSLDVHDLSPLAGMPLKLLRLKMTNITDLSPLMGMPLGYLNCTQTNVSDLEPLRDSSVEYLGIFGCWIKDYAPLATMRQLDLERHPQYSFLLGDLTEPEFRVRYLEQNGDDEDRLKQVVIYIAMKRYADRGPAAALEILDAYKKKWGASPPMGYDNVRADFIDVQVNRLNAELAEQPPS